MTGISDREAGELCGYPPCSIVHYVHLMSQGRWSGWEMGSIYVGERAREILVDQGTDITWVPCPYHRDHPPEGTVYEPPDRDPVIVTKAPILLERLRRYTQVACAYGVSLPQNSPHRA